MLLIRLEEVLAAERPAAILAQGDTTTVLATALAAFYDRIPLGHVEAGLRTGDITNPFPEEMNRVVASHLTRWHFAPTQLAADRLLAEGYAPDSVQVTGNTVIDALHHVAAMNPDTGLDLDPGKRLLLANKEALVMSGALFMQAVRQSGAVLLPIDSEHSAIFQCLPEDASQSVSARSGRVLAWG